MKNTVKKYGLYGALTICVLFLLAWFVGAGLDYSMQEVIGYASMIIALLFVYFGIKHFRDNENNGELTFKKGLGIGLLITLITAIAFGILDVIYTEFLNPDFMTEYYARTVEQMKASLPPDEFNIKLAEMESQKEMFSNPLFSFLLMAFTVFIIGFIISLISAFILKSNGH